MKIKTKFKRLITALLDNIRERRKVILALSCLVVFFTTYLLILPAFTLDKEEAAEQGGIDVPGVEQSVDADEKAEEPAVNEQAKFAKKETKKSDTKKKSADVTLENVESDDFSVAIESNDTILSEDMSVAVREIDKSDKKQKKEYESLYNDALEAVQKAQEEEGLEKPSDFEFAKFYDISLMEGNTEVKPGSAVDVKISFSEELQKELKVTDPNRLHIVHFAVDKDTGEVTPEVLDNESTAITVENKKVTEAAFTTESFSVFAVVYTVDFHWEVDGQKYSFSIKGGDSISFSILAELMNLSTNYKKLQNVDSSNSESVTQNDEDSAENPDDVKGSVIDISDLNRDSIKLSEETKAFLDNVELVEFSNPDLVWVHKIKEDTTAGKLIAEFGLSPHYPYGITQNECMEMYLRSYSAPDWVIMALKPFDTEEKLTITMKDGERFEIRVTDAGADATEIDDGQGGKKVQTIANPSGTSIDLFDYWIVDNKRYVWNRLGWPEQIGDQNSYNYKDYNYNGTKLSDNNPPMHQDYNVPSSIQWYVDNDHLRGNGNNQGINTNHAFKFYPGVAGTVEDYGNKGNNQWTNNHDGYSSINSWTGDADPTTGLVLGYLVDKYPKLTNDPSKGTGTGNSSQVAGKYPSGESLAYLFNPAISHSGKEYMGSVDQLLYVDSDGYYTYDSRYYSATYNSDKTFTVRKFADNVSGNARGFWPMGDQYNWHGMHVTTEFSMPVDGKVLNPKGEYKDMQFEFSGDDDTWLYVDGILVGDGGGIHNRTEIDINFATGIVTVTGTKDDNHPGTYTSTKTLREIFENAERQGWVEPGYVAKNFESGSNTFKSGTYHTFEMFYLERGGSESNLYIHYNLVSTTDFSAHKSYHMLQDDPHARLERDQFQFELIGFDNAENGAGFEQAIMPDRGTENGAGTVASPKKKHYDTAPEGLDLPSNLTAHTSLITGVTEDGNVNFGNVQLQASQLGKQYKYIVREIVPPDAENADHVRWDEASPEVKAEGGFIKDNITYDGKVYYFIGTVRLKEGTTDEYEVKKTRYTDSSYEIEDTETKFFNFVNGYVKPITLKVLKKSETGKALSGAEFSLTRAMKNDSDQWVVRTYQHDGETVASTPRTGTTSAGVLRFDNLTEGHYILEETAAPTGYTRNETYRWLLSLTKQDAADEIDLVPTIQALDENGNPIGQAVELTPDANNVIEHEVLNGRTPRGDITVEKKWLKADGTSVYTDEELAVLDVDGTTITGELWRKGESTAPAEPPTVTIYAKLSNQGDNQYQQKWQGQVESGSDITYSMAVNSTGYPQSQSTSTGAQPVQVADQNITYDNGITKSSGHVYKLENITQDVNIYAIFDSSKANNQGIGFYLVSKVDPTTSSTIEPIDEKFDDFTLQSGSWSKTWTATELYGSDLDDDWMYYFKNVEESSAPDGFTFAEDPVVSISGTTTTYTYKNTAKPGSLNLTKVVLDNDQTPTTDAQKQHVDGTYVFKISSDEGTVPAVTKYVQIIVANGAATSYKVADSEAEFETMEAETGSPAVIAGLAEGDYIIEEVNKNGLMLISFVRGDNNASAVDDELGTVKVHVTAGDTNAEQNSAQATFTNSYYSTDGPDKIALDIVKTFSGISSLDEVPDGNDGFEVVIGYTLNGVEKTIKLHKEQNEINSDNIKIVAVADGLKISWHITNIPTEAKAFKIKEVNYDSVTGYDFTAATLDTDDITSTAGSWHNMNVTAPTATLTDVTTDRHTPDSEADLRYELKDEDILLSKLTANQGTLIISKTALNSLERDAVVKGWPQQGGFKKPGIYFSIEEHPEGFRYGGKTITFSEKDGKTFVTFTSNAAAQEAVFAVSYDSHAELNNASLTNTYTQKTVALDIVKVKKDDANTKLKDAQFELRKLTNNTEAGYPIPTESGTFDGDTVEGSPITTDDNGEGSFAGLVQGYYELTEAKAPDGYILKTDNPVYFKVNDGVIYWVEWSTADNKWVDKTTGDMVSFEAADSAAETNAVFTIENEPGAELPHTGGIGTTIFYILGSLLVIGGGIYFVSRRRMK